MSSTNSIAAIGQRLTVEWASDTRGRLPALEFYEELSREDRQKVLALFKRLADAGAIANREHFKCLGGRGGNLWEFKRFQLRFLGDYRPGGRFLVAIGLRKKKDDLSDADIRKAARILAEHDQRLGRRSRDQEPT
ncbi:MAG TPA: type II toxin-antitoxin system RelE/ParE family toxin [Thermoanaerobaculia bacterium]|jgi:hypothetical protein|nr:type II toxin-antitoxin system RelE/ParE family toxin [Thermoanaerobaculia bacterium]